MPWIEANGASLPYELIAHPQQSRRLHLGQFLRMPTFIRLLESHLPILL